jgi:hypothetical protein
VLLILGARATPAAGDGAALEAIGLRVGQVEFPDALACIGERNPDGRTFAFGNFLSD